MSFKNLGWYVVLTKPRLEFVARDNLLRQHFIVRLPMVRKITHRKIGLEPLFPRYLFLKTESDKQSLSPVRSTTGVSSIVRFGATLAVLSSDKCDSIMAFAKTQQEGGVGSLLDVEGIKVGQKVLIRNGAFIGLEGLVSSVAEDRVIVLMSLLGKEQLLGFDPIQISAS